MRNRVSSYGICVLMLVTFALGLMVTSAVAGKAAALVVDPTSGKPKAALTISGSGFEPKEVVDLVLATGPGILHGLGTRKVDAIVANEFGAFSVKTAIPKVSPVGVYSIEAAGDKGSLATHPLVVTK